LISEDLGLGDRWEKKCKEWILLHVSRIWLL